jgi:acetoacetyl-CoA synthetase
VKEPIWKPPDERMSNANMTRFIAFVNEQEGKRFTTYEELYRWSIENIPAFWTAVWDFCEVKASKRFETVVDDLDKMPGARWFTGAKLNFAENLLRYRA